LGLPDFSSLEAAAVFCVARFVAGLCWPGTGLQLPFVCGCLPGTGSKPGQQGFFFRGDFWVADFFAVAMRAWKRFLGLALHSREMISTES